MHTQRQIPLDNHLINNSNTQAKVLHDLPEPLKPGTAAGSLGFQQIFFFIHLGKLQ